MTAIGLALAASLFWGIADFGAGWTSRRLPVLFVLLCVEGSGLIVMLAVLALTREALPETEAILAAAGAGTAGILALGCFYWALSIGTMSVVAPISATGVAIPVVVGIATGDALGTAVALGLVLAVIGIVLASREAAEEATHGHAKAVVLALIAAAGFGLYFLLADHASEFSVAWTLCIARAAATPLVLLAVLAVRAVPGPGTDRRLIGLALLAGMGDLAATACFGIASTKGELSVVAVLAALYPVWTVVAAAVLLKERLARLQAVGVALALAGTALVAAGAG